MTDVRVGIVSWNTAELLDRCLAALPAALDGLDAEIVVVDNASSDESVARASTHPVVVCPASQNLGYAKAMNMALADTGAPVLVALNPDTLPAPGSLAALVACLHRHPEAALVAPRLLNEDGTEQHSVYRFPSVRLALVANLLPRVAQGGAVGRRWWLEGQARHDRPGPVDWAVGAVHCIRADSLDGAPYRERWFMYVEDLDLCWRLRQRGWSVWFEPQVSIVHVGDAAGSQAWGGMRTARWLDATYDWYSSERGPWATRAYALLNLVGAGTRLALLRAVDGRGRRAGVRRWLADQLRVSVPVHARALVRPPAPGHPPP